MGTHPLPQCSTHCRIPSCIPPAPNLQSVDQLQRWVEANAADQKLAEEIIRLELDALTATVDAQKQMLEEEIVNKVHVSTYGMC